MGGAYRLMENKKTGGGTRMYALITYAGLAAVVVCTMELLKPFLTFIPQEYLTLFVFCHRYRGADPGRGHDPEAEFEDGGGKKKDNHLS